MQNKINPSCLRLGLLLCAVLVGIPLDADAMVCAVSDATTGIVYATTQEPPACDEHLLLSQTDYDALRNPFGLDPDFSVVYWSAGATLLLWVMGIGSGSVFNVIRKAK